MNVDAQVVNYRVAGEKGAATLAENTHRASRLEHLPAKTKSLDQPLFPGSFVQRADSHSGCTVKEQGGNKQMITALLHEVEK